MTGSVTQKAKPRTCLGKITGPHGVKGLVKILPYGDDPYLIEDLSPLYTEETGDKTVSVTLKSASGKYFLAQIKDCNSREGAEAIQGTELWADRDSLPDLSDDDDFYIMDLIGLRVVNSLGTEIGSVAHVQNYGAGDLLEIKPMGGQTFFMPFKNGFVTKVDLESRVILVENEHEFMTE